MDTRKWQRLPSLSEAANAYPYAALRKRAEGHSILLCTVLATGRLASCTVKMEDPEGWRFGEAEMVLAEDFWADPTKLTADDLATPIELPMRWQIPDR